NSLTAHSTGGCVDNAAGDGAAQCKLNGTTWNYPITVWRGQTFQAEDAQGGAWQIGGNGAGCIPPANNCSWNPGGMGFIASQCTTPGANGCAIIVDSNNGMGKRVGYFNGPSKGLKFSGVNVACAGTANLTIYTTNGDVVGTTARHLSFIVNGGAPQDVTFTGANDWSHPAGQAVTLSGFNAGTNNTIYVTATGSAGAPDVDWIEVTNTGGACATTSVTGTCDESKWVESSNVNDGTEAAGNDGSLTTRFTTGRAMKGGDYYQADMTGTVYLSGIVLNNQQTSSSDYPASVDVYSSNDGSSWNKIVSGAAGGTTTTISFTKTLMRYVRVQINAANSNNNYWSIGELQTTCSTN
ncbi:MAG TPA: discoidin domain-containing protein, partial [Polyangia bacterium]|nr:discoidin domain-containing protein [Polyangia bacterium]